MVFARIAQAAAYAPEQVITNDDLSEIMDTSDEWISSRTGIRRRHITRDETTSDLGTQVVKQLLSKAGLSAVDIDFIIVATITPDSLMPSTAARIQGNIGAVNAFAMDVTAACSGFVFALSTADKFIQSGIYTGKVRDYNITKKEWVLKGETVLYASADSIRETLDFDFMQEKNFSYKDLNINDAIIHIAKFISGIWQIHAFGEGNTRTTAVFAIKYLRTFGFDISNEAFANHSWYFRNALVRANYNNLSKGIYATTEYIEAFFRNLILSEHNELKNRVMLVQESSVQGVQSANTTKEISPKCNICTLNCTLEEMAVLNFLREQPKATQKEIAAHIGKSERTVKTITVNLTEKGIIERKNGKRNGFWEVKTNNLNS